MDPNLPPASAPAPQTNNTLVIILVSVIVILVLVIAGLLAWFYLQPKPQAQVQPATVPPQQNYQNPFEQPNNNENPFP